MTRQEVLNILREKNKRCSAAKSTYNSAKQAWEEAQANGECAFSIQHLGALKDTAYAMWQSTEKEIEAFILSDW